MTDHPPPADLDAERATLGSILLNREAIIPIAAWLKPESFYQEKHGWIYAAALGCYDRGEPPDIRTIGAELLRQSRLEAIGGYEYLAELVNATPTSYHVESYARTVDRCAALRGLIVAGGRIAAIGYDLTHERASAQAAAQAELDRLLDAPDPDAGLTSMETLVSAQYEAIARYAETGEPIGRGVATGLRDLDEQLNGLQDGDLIIVGARPSVGKSALVTNWAHAMGAADQRVLFFSLEMSKEQITQRLIAIDSGLEHERIRHGRLSEQELPLCMASLGKLAALPIAIDDRRGLAIGDIRSRVLRDAALHGPPRCIIVDYLQLMSGRRQDNRVLEVGEISRGLKNLAGEMSCPVVALCQLSRAVEGRQDHIPLLSDLRESGSLEQDADIVLFLYREELYHKETDKKGIAELHIAKNRNGPISVVPVRFEPSTQRFMDLTWRLPDVPRGGAIERAWPNND